ncbi:MAG: hypothetical protein KME35_02065 [Aphanocapsa sp. GSE-SYN-MK-11-07L]|jgi:hypothetical protein|nr:hypothetical protein [Aphanocapsa sp. GSE-SYN-MK-11-07L]
MTLEPSESPLIDQLIDQRDRYQSYLDHCNQQATHARQQLVRINALLLDQFLPTPDASTIALPATLHEFPDPSPLTSGTSAPEVDQLSKPAPKANSKPSKPAIALNAKPPADKKRPGSPLQLPLLAPYRSMSKIAAVGQVLQAHRGSSVKPETIIQSLYGELSAADQKAEQGRMRATLNQGVRKGLWSKSKGRGGDYALEQPKPSSKTAVEQPPSKAKPSRSALSPGRKSQKPPKPKSQPATEQAVAETAPGRGKARGQSLMEQVIDVMLAHPREAMTSEAVAKEIFGSLPSREWAAIRKRISGVFSQGVKEGKWERVPNESGAYIYQ